MPRHQAVSRSRTSTKVRAVLAGALVLGVGATMTLASWTDTEFATGSFSASRFDTESTVDNSTWRDNNGSPNVGTIAFSGSGMSPDTHRYGYVLVHAKANTVGGTLTFAAPTVVNGVGETTPLLGAALQYRAVSTTTATCTSSNFSGSPTWIVGGTSTYSALTTAAGASVTLPAAVSSTVVGTPIGYCFDVYLPTGADTLLQGKSVAVTWTITATSTP